VTPDGRYLVVRGRLWRRSDPGLAPDRRQALVDRLMRARQAVRAALAAEDAVALAAARAEVQAAKVGLGERGPVWWDDGAPDLQPADGAQHDLRRVVRAAACRGRRGLSDGLGAGTGALHKGRLSRSQRPCATTTSTRGSRSTPTLSRRGFGLAAAAAAAASTAARKALRVTERDVAITTPDGTADAALYHPEGRGSWPAVLVWPDVVSLRPVFREMGRRLAGEGYVVLVPNLYYRVRKAPVVDGAFNFANAEDRAKLTPMRATVTPEATARDALAYFAFLDAQRQTNKRRKAGVQGYCMGGPLSFRTAAALPGRIGAVASFHGGGLTTRRGGQPAPAAAAHAGGVPGAGRRQRRQRDPEGKEKLKAALLAAKLKHKVEVYAGADHGWTVRGSAVYQEAAAERAWAELLALYRRALV
jgi:carboxymethylenebutenolidase